MSNKYINFKARIYNEHFEYINGIKFTIREVEVIALLTRYRDEKKIAQILSIASKTVNTHIRNIMQKIIINSKDYIVDFVSKSGKHKLFDCYYKEIIREYYFFSQLKNIKKPQNAINCALKCNKVDNNLSIISEKIRSVFQKMNINLVEYELIYQKNGTLYIDIQNGSNKFNINRGLFVISLYRYNEKIIEKYIDNDVELDLCIMSMIVKIIDEKKYQIVIDDTKILFEKVNFQMPEKNSSKIINIISKLKNKIKIFR